MPRPSTTEPRRQGAVLVPVKSFALAKGRLQTALSPEARSGLARAMATHVITAQGEIPVFVACDSDDVADWARSEGAEIVWCHGTDLNGAIQAGVEAIREHGFGEVAIVHSDLPLATDVGPLLGWPGITIVPDRHRTGTNVMVLPTSVEFGFRYGSGSFGLHVAEAVRHRCGLRVVHHPHFEWDIDHPDDLGAPGAALLTPYLETEPA